MDDLVNITKLKGVGEKTAKLLNMIDIETVGDLKSYYPRRYEEYADTVMAEEAFDNTTCAVFGIITRTPQIKKVRNLQIITTQIKDESGTIELKWFNMPFLASKLKLGYRFIFRGTVKEKKGVKSMEQPSIYTVEEYEQKKNSLEPVYGLTKGLTNNLMVKLVKQIFDSEEVEREYLPEEIRSRYSLAEYNYAIRRIHFPRNREDLMYARKRMVFDEFLFFIMAMQKLNEGNDKRVSEYVVDTFTESDRLVSSLPYKLTNAQLKVYEEIRNDMSTGKVMNRLVQGDVGSGKTIIAFLALIAVTQSGYQGALMAPTEVLAKQHYESFTDTINKYNLNIRLELLTGSMTAKQKREAYARIEDGEADIIIGTHALIQEKVNYKNIALVITDEQHRFGVKQRETFSNKGSDPHILVMSATPIPRTLAIIMYGDLDISIIDELPAMRLPIKNCVVDTSYRSKAYSFIEKEVRAGRQVYVICPMVEESEGMDGENVIDYAKKLSDELSKEIHIEYLHGKMKPRDKNDIMERFARNEIQVLVSTTVVEVGVNVPNATVMMVENAEKFGLAQLHQLRGRVGRGKHQSYCIFVAGSKSKDTKKRLEILNSSNDGFYIAREDLKLRGPGDFFGIRQSGDMEFRLADVFTDAAILKDAKETADTILNDDYMFESDRYRKLGEKLEVYLSKGIENLNI